MLTVYCGFRRERIVLSRLHARLGYTFACRNPVEVNPLELHAILSFAAGDCDLNGRDLMHALNEISEQVSWDFITDDEENGYLVSRYNEKKRTLVSCNELIHFECRDGTVTRQRGPMCAYFTFIADYVAEYPGKPIAIDFAQNEFEAALGVLEDRTTRLVVCRRLVEFLNPVYNAYPLCFDLTGIPIEDMKAMAARLTAEERLTLRYVYSTEENPPLPKGGEGHYILAALPSIYEYYHAFDLFPECPSWLFYHFSCALYGNVRAASVLHNLVQNADFSLDSDVVASYSLTCAVQMGLDMALRNEHTKTWEQVARILAMMGHQNERLGNASLVVVPPYWSGDWAPISNESMEVVMALYPGVWDVSVLHPELS